MPGTGGRLGTKQPAPAAITTTWRDQLGAGIGGELPAAVGQLLQRRRHLVEMELRIERLDLFQQPVGQFLAGDDGQAGNVVDRFFRIELGALPARPVENVDQMAFEIEQPQLEHREQADGARADNDDICFNRGGSGHDLVQGAYSTPNFM